MAETEERISSPTKKLKIENNTSENDDSVHDKLADLSTFKTDTILSNNTNAKRVCLKGSFTGKNGVALVILEKTAFAENDLTNDSKYFADDCFLRKEFSNDIYGNYQFYPNVELNGKYGLWLCDIVLEAVPTPCVKHMPILFDSLFRY